MGTTEDIVRYCRGGYHPVTIGDFLKGARGSYRVMHKLGFGSYATVWLAQRTGTTSGGFVSLKITIADEQGDKEAEMLELATGSGKADAEGMGIDGPSHVLTLLDRFEHRGPNGVHWVIVTDVVAPLLSFHISRRLPRWRKIAAYGLAKAVAQLHAAGVVHGGQVEFLICLLRNFLRTYYLLAGRLNSHRLRPPPWERRRRDAPVGRAGPVRRHARPRRVRAHCRPPR
uniref:non-specific serine/threonine protein kinase n=1 Tax=Schizophyllum commune (strain H4-8 / FGSC 9210) TaxID=578458 RepID=D8QLY2_SCHCM